MSTAPSQPDNTMVEVLPAEGIPPSAKPTLLARTDRYRVIRFGFAAGQELAEHCAPGELMAHCLQGQVAFTAEGRTSILEAGQMICLEDRVPHSVAALRDSVMLLTIVATD